MVPVRLDHTRRRVRFRYSAGQMVTRGRECRLITHHGKDKIGTYRCEAVLGVHEASVRRHASSRPDSARQEHREHRKPRMVQLDLSSITTRESERHVCHKKIGYIHHANAYKPLQNDKTNKTVKAVRRGVGRTGMRGRRGGTPYGGCAETTQ